MPSPSNQTTPAPGADLPPPLPHPPGATAPWDLASVQWIKDHEHLRLLSIFHYVLGGLAIAISSLFIFHIFFGAVILNSARSHHSPFFPVEVFDSPEPTASPYPEATPARSAASTPAPSPRHINRNAKPPAFLGYMLVGLGSFAVLLGWTFGALLIYSGRCLSRHTRRVFSMVLAGIGCLQIPMGTVLGVFTLNVLMRPSVLALYAANEQR